MEDAINKLAREMADAIAAAVASDPRIGACRAKARAEGYQLQVSIEALIGFGTPENEAGETEDVTPVPLAITGQDRRFLRSLRISADDEIIEELE